jgi:uncharacterized protein
VVASFEHYTDLLVVLILQGDFLDGCDPRMNELFSWHAAEEVEHNAVAYGMLRAVAGGYWLRMLGNVLGLLITVGFMLSGALMLLRQDKKLRERKTWRELGQLFFTKYSAAKNIVKMFWHYARPNYRPDDIDHSELAAKVLIGDAPSQTAS